MHKLFPIFIFFFLPGEIILAQHKDQGYVADKKLYYGVAYYPEVWDREKMTKDIAYMKELNMNVVRLAEFSWSLMEPEEGVYKFDWLHEIVDLLNENGIEVILGTPTATPPVWLASNYPDIFLTDENGRKMEHGARKSYRYTSETYKRFSKRICEEMAKEFGRKPGVIAWQTDNEFKLSLDYCNETKDLWHKWLVRKYTSIDTLNAKWATNLWSQHYDQFEQIPMPKSYIWHHPSLRLDWVKFSEEQLITFQDIQLQALRKYSELPITHDGMPGQQIDYPRLFRELDFATTNVYHSFQVYNRVQGNYDRLRGYGKGMHWLFETAPNHSGGGMRGNTWFIHQPNGAMRAAIWMNYAMGGQGALFWLWRQHPAGQEMAHGAILSAWGKPMANYSDLKILGSEISQMSALLMEHPVDKADVAIVYDHNSDKALRIEELSNGIHYYSKWTEYFYRPISDAFIHRDVIPLDKSLDEYKLVFMPLVPVIPESVRNRLKVWVESGGTLVLGPMSGYRDECFTAYTDYALGELEPWMGITVETRLPIDPFTENDDVRLKVRTDGSFFKDTSDAFLWSEALASESGNVLARYQNGMHDGKGAIIENKIGKGKVVMMGTYPGATIMRQLVLKLANELEIAPLAKGDPDILVVPRSNDDDRYLFVINLKNTRQELALPFDRCVDVLTEEKIHSNTLMLDPYEVRCIYSSSMVADGTP